MSTPVGVPGPAADERPLAVLVIDDERPALDELTWLLRRDPRVGEVHATDSPTDALRLLRQLEVDAVFLDVQMPGLSGIDLAQVLAQFRSPPATVFVTAHDEHAVEAFDLHAVDYVLKPVREQRLAEAVRRVVAAARAEPVAADPAEEQVAVERGGVTRFVAVSRIRHVEAEGDYARLHVDGESHLVRVPLSQLEQEWAAGGFVRIHRSRLVNTAYVEELHVDAGRCWVVVDGADLQVSRRHTRELRDLLVRRGRPRGTAAPGEPS
ncbi:LytR/AlgR family response regulator transcription factor [Nocardioides aurantiacus]|uniref:LytR/AlgR family response regulator transcription factor n=1 Tax=Nocardioides aurantiacus TaxID=86796 RepID=UPI000F466027|nr:LytTR family DNA-binding domain-containing protein [Nocardioides aurantiacus]